MMNEQEIARLARQIGINPADAVNAHKAEQAATAQGVPIYKWQRANPEAATLLMRIYRQHEITIQERADD